MTRSRIRPEEDASGVPKVVEIKAGTLLPKSSLVCFLMLGSFGKLVSWLSGTGLNQLDLLGSLGPICIVSNPVWHARSHRRQSGSIEPAQGDNRRLGQML